MYRLVIHHKKFIELWLGVKLIAVFYGEYAEKYAHTFVNSLGGELNNECNDQT